MSRETTRNLKSMCLERPPGHLKKYSYILSWSLKEKYNYRLPEVGEMFYVQKSEVSSMQSSLVKFLQSNNYPGTSIQVHPFLVNFSHTTTDQTNIFQPLLFHHSVTMATGHTWVPDADVLCYICWLYPVTWSQPGPIYPTGVRECLSVSGIVGLNQHKFSCF